MEAPTTPCRNCRESDVYIFNKILTDENNIIFEETPSKSCLDAMNGIKFNESMLQPTIPTAYQV